jgi:Leucine-rich repeat (LRR) protein
MKCVLTTDATGQVFSLMADDTSRSRVLKGVSVDDEFGSEPLELQVPLDGFIDWIAKETSECDDLQRVLNAVQVALFLDDVDGSSSWADRYWRSAKTVGTSERDALRLLRSSQPDVTAAVFERHPAALDPDQPLESKLLSPQVPMEARISACERALDRTTWGGKRLVIGAEWPTEAYESLFALRPHLDSKVDAISIRATAKHSSLCKLVVSQVASMTRLQSLDIGLSRHAPRVPAQLGALTGLRYLSVQNGIGSLFAQELAHSFEPHRMSTLQHVSLVRTRLGLGDVALVSEWLNSLPKLQTLDLTGTFFWGGMESLIGPLTRVTHLVLDRVPSKCFSPSHLRCLTQLLSLSVAGLWRVERWCSIGSLESLQSLSLADCELGCRDTGMISALGRLRNLRELNLSNNRMSACSLADHVEALVQCYDLERLDLSDQLPGPAWWFVGSLGIDVTGAREDWDRLGVALSKFSNLKAFHLDRASASRSYREIIRWHTSRLGNEATTDLGGEPHDPGPGW